MAKIKPQVAAKKSSEVDMAIKQLGIDIAKDAKKFALPNKKTGALDRSIRYEYTYISNDNFNVVITEMFYGVYLNSGTRNFAGTGYMDRAMANNTKGIEDIVKVISDQLEKEFDNKDEDIKNK